MYYSIRLDTEKAKSRVMIHDEIVTFEVAKLAKEKGFPQDPIENNSCQIYCWDNLRKIHSLCISAMWYIGEYNREDMYAAPTQSLLQRWLREENGYYVYPFFDNESRRWTWVCRELTGDKWIQLLDFEERYFDTYEIALEDAFKYALENLL